MSSRKLYSKVVRSGSSDEDLGLVHGEQDRKVDGHVNWLYKYQHSLRADPRRRGNSGPARKTVYLVLAAFAHERSILIGCLLLDTIIREFSRWIQTIHLLQRLVISLKFNLVTFFIKNGARVDCLF